MYMITLHTNFGDITIELNFDKAPLSAANFLQYCRDDFYTNTIFHRVIDGFMVQGGGFNEEMKQKEGRDPIQNEADNGLVNDIGTLAMARTNDYCLWQQRFLKPLREKFPRLGLCCIWKSD